MRIRNIELDQFTTQYLLTAMWAETVVLPVPEQKIDKSGLLDVDENHPLHGIKEGAPLDAHFDITNFTNGALLMAIRDCTDFQETNADDLLDEDDTRTGHDFWLTRNGHGCGFWDGDYDEYKGNRLTLDAETYGPAYIVVNSDGTLDFA